RRAVDARVRNPHGLRALAAGLRLVRDRVHDVQGHEMRGADEMKRIVIVASLASVALLIGVTSAAADGPPAPHHPLIMPNAANTANPALRPPPVCCAPVAPPPAGLPAPVNMAYFGGHVQVTPKIYLVFWGWGQAGAFDHATPGFPSYDPDGAAARMTA